MNPPKADTLNKLVELIAPSITSEKKKRNHMFINVSKERRYSTRYL